MNRLLFSAIFRRLAPLCVAIAAILVAASPASAATDAAAQQNDKVAKALDELNTLKNTPLPPNLKTRDAITLARDKMRRTLADKAWTLFTANPKDPRRWDAAAFMFANKPFFYAGVSDSGGYSMDTAAEAAWFQRSDKIVADSHTATDVPDADREPIAYQDVVNQLKTADASLSRGKTVGVARIGENLKAYFEHWPEGDAGSTLLIQRFVNLCTRAKVPEVQVLTPFADTPHTATRVYVAQRLEILDKLQKPVDMTFTALDESEVDVSKMRGKVVLVYFWRSTSSSSLSSPLEDLAFLKDAYSRYHKKGFEIVGISLDLSRNRAQLLDFIAKQKIPWPQYYDGQGNQTEYAVQYGIKFTPTGLLLDKTGKVAAQGDDVRGAKLDPAIQKLLKQ